MASNKSLGDAKNAKKDEFYTQLCDIEAELKHYTRFFKDKTVLCNCDDPYESNFFYYFASRFNDLGLKKLIATCYDGSPVAYTQLDLFDPMPRHERRAYKIVITEVGDENGDGTVDIADVEYLIKNRKNVLTRLNGNGDFRSPECVELLKEADVVVTNPPVFPLPRIRCATDPVQQEVSHYRQHERSPLQGNLFVHQGKQDMARLWKW